MLSKHKSFPEGRIAPETLVGYAAPAITHDNGPASMARTQVVLDQGRPTQPNLMEAMATSPGHAPPTSGRPVVRPARLGLRAVEGVAAAARKPHPVRRGPRQEADLPDLERVLLRATSGIQIIANRTLGPITASGRINMRIAIVSATIGSVRSSVRMTIGRKTVMRNAARADAICGRPTWEFGSTGRRAMDW